ncbi:9915_t:CDS:2 [Ambispora gerdemannii]|uniref:Molybdenum cofactor sulfurase n=1 Tax=Ambispora gerdemannii TaxID=144530 RepID=A0A9N9BLT8_9GLOM|nr:9915_t:CDS:2 [Ambispora gerdemannii]
MPPYINDAEREYHIPEASKFNADKLSFLKEFSKQYGYDGRIEEIREKEYPQLKGSTYLDHAGTTTYPQNTLSEFHADLTKNLFGNPHSRSPSSKLSTDRVEEVRLRVLKHFNASPEHFEVIFTANATAAIKLVGEVFPWARDESSYKYLREGHTSLLGLRRFAEDANVREIVATTENDVEAEFNIFNNYRTSPISNPHFLNNIPQVDFDGHTDGVPIINNGVTYNLFAYPAQCNFSGMRFPLNWTRRLKQTFNTANKKTLVLLDAAAYATTSPLSFAEPENSPDFTAISFYKLFGYPTGLGALVIKKELSPILKKRYFGGGSVTSLVWDMNWQMFNERLCDRYEDGTINFLSIIALNHAFNAADRLYRDFRFIRSHVTALNNYLQRNMAQIKHWNGAPLCVINSDRDFSDSSQQGPILSFNLKHADGSWIGYNEVERMAGENGIHVRAGGHCNAGSVARWMGVSPEDFASKSCHDDQDIINGKPMGAVRVSLAAMTTIEDILVWLDFLKTYFVERKPVSMSKNINHKGVDVYDDLKDQASSKNTIAESKIALETIIIYPVKSCHGYVIPSSKSWTITPQGLLYDREWMVVDAETGRALNQKQFPRMALIRPRILFDDRVLLLKAPGQPPLRISLDEYPVLGVSTCTLSASMTNESKVCGNKIDTLYYTAPSINEWFSNFLGLTCILARQTPNEDGINDDDSLKTRRFIKPHLAAPAKAPISLSNESPFLLISQPSVNDLNRKIRKSGNKEVDASCFRGNFQIKGTSEYEEDDWSMVKLGSQVFKTTGEKTNEPYRTLTKHRKFDGKVYFGQHMIHVPELSEAPYELAPGAPIKILDRHMSSMILSRF